jgi:hypothetical protein
MFHSVSDMTEWCKGEWIWTFTHLYSDKSCTSGQDKVVFYQKRITMFKYLCSDQTCRNERGDTAVLQFVYPLSCLVWIATQIVDWQLKLTWIFFSREAPVNWTCDQPCSINCLFFIVLSIFLFAFIHPVLLYWCSIVILCNWLIFNNGLISHFPTTGHYGKKNVGST